VIEALASGVRVDEVFAVDPSEGRVQELAGMAREAGVPVRQVSADVMGHLTSTVTPQGVVAVAGFVDVALSSFGSGATFVAVLAEVRDPGNAGTVLRSADAAGADAVVFTRSSVDVYNPKTVRATAGSLFHVPVVREIGVEEATSWLREQGFAILGASPDGQRSIYETDLSARTAVLFGNEARGLSSEAVALADATVRVPTLGRAESLNLAAAATLVMFEAARQRSGGDPLAHVVAGAAHDIRSPLTAMRGFAGTLLSKWDRLGDDQRSMMLEALINECSRMEVVVTQLVDTARVLSNRLELRSEPTDALALARTVAEDMGRWASLDVVVSGEGATARLDPSRLRTILIALIEGAQWWGESGPIQVRVDGGPIPRLRVSRSGSCLDADGAKTLFRPRAPGTGGGSKAGLFVAKALAEAQGGRLEVETDGAVTFLVEFPSLG
jgi:TrmH family RNA methyltransferase